MKLPTLWFGSGMTSHTRSNIRTSRVRRHEERLCPNAQSIKAWKWVRPIPWLPTVFEFLVIRPIIDRQSLVQVSAEIGVESERLTQIENECELRTCGSGLLDLDSLPWKQPLPLFRSRHNV